MKTPLDPADDELRRQLSALVARETRRARRLFGCQPQQTTDAFVRGLIENLASPDDGMARLTALVIVEELVPEADLLDGAFWRLPLGQALAWVIGYHHTTVPQARAADIAGVSRQRIHELVNSGRLPRINGGIPANAVRELLHWRYAQLGE